MLLTKTNESSETTKVSSSGEDGRVLRRSLLRFAADAVLSLFNSQAVQVKPLHLFVVAVVSAAASQVVTAQTPFGYRPAYFRSVHDPDNVFLAQADGVPVPPEAAGSAGAAAGPSGGVDAGAGALSVPAGDAPQTWNAFSPQFGPDPFVADPYGGAAGPYAPYSPYGQGGIANPYAAGQPFRTFGTNGARPYRQGWHPSLDIEWLPSTGISQAGRGDFGQFGVNYDMAYTGPFMPGWMFTWTNQFRMRNWDGPDGVTPGPGLPGKAFRFGVDFELETPHAGPVSLSLGVTPSINTDFDSSLGDASFQLDGRGLIIMQVDQYWTLVLGAGFWDRVSDRVIPYAGLVYRDDLWEWRIMYPETTVSVFMGNGPGGAMWMYARAEYVVEAYEVRTATGTDEVELEDYRAVLGIRTETGSADWFIEGGWVFNREVDYSRAANPKFNPNTGFIARTGWRY